MGGATGAGQAGRWRRREPPPCPHPYRPCAQQGLSADPLGSRWARTDCCCRVWRFVTESPGHPGFPRTKHSGGDYPGCRPPLRAASPVAF